MLTVRVTATREVAERVRAVLEAEPTVSDLVVVSAEASGATRDIVFFELARENANRVMQQLRHVGVPLAGAIVVTEPLTVISDAAATAERLAPGHPADGVVWAQLSDRTQEDARPSWVFFVFLLLATLIAGVGRILDQPILVIGAMVVGPEFAPIAALCYAIVRGKRTLVGEALATLVSGFAAAVAIAWAVWAVAYAAGWITFTAATTGPRTSFIIEPSGWSFVIALLAGVAGVLSMTTEKSSALVGVFISITTVPAAGTLALTAAVGAWDEALASIVQLGVNVLGLVIAGTATLAVQLHVSRPIRRRLATRRGSLPRLRR
ncbi:DUF389 domain-containing protein [Microbacterium thalassium]|uniref:Putative hydrophobic protein (TIGR00271 family) n=1 Tax=Microbacterium thalassium TaxID=362649 RepID=A0A7X0FNC6_9MICO|nr:DUF389 domain-containing protein [Microbacterium thalassium]MBB6390220.1 putative hydrophobic protein (TIGR00271 family) [Microbacterium thalassium]GLK25328.1 hypothetical protein GCM10017607_26470 [Microbacterium thalassium]